MSEKNKYLVNKNRLKSRNIKEISVTFTHIDRDPASYNTMMNADTTYSIN